jgi:hypothetical protein
LTPGDSQLKIKASGAIVKTIRRFLQNADLGTLARRALAFGYAALDRPTPRSIRKAKTLLVRVLSLVDQQLSGGELGELVSSLQRMMQALLQVESRLARSS